MKILKSVSDVTAAIAESKLTKPTKTHSTAYPDRVTYICGCGATHRVNDLSCRLLYTGWPVKFAMLCGNNIVTWFRIKGLIRQRTESFWSCKMGIFFEAVKNYESSEGEIR